MAVGQEALGQVPPGLLCSLVLLIFQTCLKVTQWLGALLLGLSYLSITALKSTSR